MQEVYGYRALDSYLKQGKSAVWVPRCRCLENTGLRWQKEPMLSQVWRKFLLVEGILEEMHRWDLLFSQTVTDLLKVCPRSFGSTSGWFPCTNPQSFQLSQTHDCRCELILRPVFKTKCLGCSRGSSFLTADKNNLGNIPNLSSVYGQLRCMSSW